MSFTAIYIIWGSTYLFIKLALQSFPPFILAGIRFLIASLLIFAYVFARRRWIGLQWSQVRNSMIAGTLFLAIGNGAACWALQYLDTGFAALLIASQPLLLLIMLRTLEKQMITLRSALGVILGMTGVYLLVSQNELVSHANHWLAVGILFISLLSWGYASIFVGKAVMPKDHFFNTGIQMFVGGIFLVLSSFVFGERPHELSEVSSLSWLSIGYLVVFGSIIAFTAFNFLLKHVSPEKVATSTYVNPVVAMILGWLILDEHITGQSIFAAAILFLGVFFINVNKSRKKI